MLTPPSQPPTPSSLHTFIPFFYSFLNWQGILCTKNISPAIKSWCFYLENFPQPPPSPFFESRGKHSAFLSVFPHPLKNYFSPKMGGVLEGCRGGIFEPISLKKAIFTHFYFFFSFSPSLFLLFPPFSSFLIFFPNSHILPLTGVILWKMYTPVLNVHIQPTEWALLEVTRC